MAVFQRTHYILVNPITGKKYKPNPNRVWAYIPESMNKLIKEKRVLFPEDISKRPMLKRFKKEPPAIYFADCFPCQVRRVCLTTIVNQFSQKG